MRSALPAFVVVADSGASGAQFQLALNDKRAQRKWAEGARLHRCLNRYNRLSSRLQLTLVLRGYCVGERELHCAHCPLVATMMLVSPTSLFHFFCLIHRSHLLLIGGSMCFLFFAVASELSSVDKWQMWTCSHLSGHLSTNSPDSAEE